MKIAYVKHPITKDEKAKILKDHDKILDERFKPIEAKKPKPKKAKTKKAD